MPLFGPPNVDELKRKRDVEGLIRVLRHRDSIRRRSAADALRALGDLRAIDPLTAALADEDEKVGVAAARALAGIGDPKAIGPIIDRIHELRSMPFGKYHEEPQESLADVLTQFGDAAAEAVANAVSADRLWLGHAVRALRGMRGSDAAADALLILLSRPGPRVFRIAEALGAVGTPRAIKALARLLVEDDYYETRAQACQALKRARWQPRNSKEATWYALAEIEQAEVLPWVYMTPEDDPHEVPDWAETLAQALISEWGPEVADHALDALQRGDYVRTESLLKVLWALADLLDRRAVGPLAQLAESGEARIAYYSTCVLVNVKAEGVVPVLSRIAATKRAVTILAHDEDAFQHIGERKVDNEAQRRIASEELERRRGR
jgi:hypothetical protein